MKLRLAVEHTKRSLSASTGAATCAVVSIERMSPILPLLIRSMFAFIRDRSPSRKEWTCQLRLTESDSMGWQPVSIVASASASVKPLARHRLILRNLMKYVCAWDESVRKGPNFVSVVFQILLVGASTLLPGIANHLALQVAPTVPITSTLDPSQVIAVGCALQAYHLAQLPRDLPVNVVLNATACKTSISPIGIVFPGLPQAGQSNLHGIVIPSNIRLPCRRRVQFAVAPGAGRVAFELWEASTEIDISQVQPQGGHAEDDSDEDEEEEPEEVRTVVHKGQKLLTAVQVPLVADTAEVVIEVIMTAEGELSWRLC